MVGTAEGCIVLRSYVQILTERSPSKVSTGIWNAPSRGSLYRYHLGNWKISHRQFGFGSLEMLGTTLMEVRGELMKWLHQDSVPFQDKNYQSEPQIIKVNLSLPKQGPQLNKSSRS